MTFADKQADQNIRNPRMSAIFTHALRNRCLFDEFQTYTRGKDEV
jgi:hypothetical protein